jgi:hypothetical protein
MQAIMERCCGLDVHQETVVAGLLVGAPGRPASAGCSRRWRLDGSRTAPGCQMYFPGGRVDADEDLSPGARLASPRASGSSTPRTSLASVPASPLGADFFEGSHLNSITAHKGADSSVAVQLADATAIFRTACRQCRATLLVVALGECDELGAQVLDARLRRGGF